jgi:hypothetical protein
MGDRRDEDEDFVALSGSSQLGVAHLQESASSARVSALLSVGSHAIVLATLAFIARNPPPMQGILVDVSSDSALVLEEEAAAQPASEPAPVATAPEPTPDPIPEPEPVPEPVPVVEAEPEPDVVKDDMGKEAPPVAPPPPAPPAAQVPGPASKGNLIESTGTAPEVVRVLPPARTDPVATFAGVQGTPARRVVYLIDGSGAMAQALRYVRSELIRSVGRLRRDQSFTVIVYRQPVGETQATLDHFAIAQGSPVLVHATGDVKQQLVSWLDNVSPSGKSDPLAGLRAALQMQPDLVFVLAKGIQRSVIFDADTHNRELLRELDALNPKQGETRTTRIKTIQFLDDDPTGLMQLIAKEHGDDDKSYRLVTRREVREGVN